MLAEHSFDTLAGGTDTGRYDTRWQCIAAGLWVGRAVGGGWVLRRSALSAEGHRIRGKKRCERAELHRWGGGWFRGFRALGCVSEA